MSPVPTKYPALVLPRLWPRAGCARRSIVLVVLAGLVFWLSSALMFSGTAAAAVAAPRGPEADVPAPMCDPMGASIAAQPDMDLPFVDRGRFEQLPCEALALMLRSPLLGAHEQADQAVRAGDPERPEQPAREADRTRHDGSRSFSSTFPVPLAPVMLDLMESLGLAPSRGHHRSVYRPPVLAARA
jgi:hypothetical protein